MSIWQQGLARQKGISCFSEEYKAELKKQQDSKLIKIQKQKYFFYGFITVFVAYITSTLQRWS